VSSIPVCAVADRISARYDDAIRRTKRKRALRVLQEFDHHQDTCKSCQYETGKQK
jgi:hypothetical protein